VTRGQVLGFVDREDVRTSARVESRRQALESAEAEYQRNRQLHEQGMISAQALSEQDVRLANAQADYDNARLQEAKGRLTSPLTGVLTKVTTAAEGEHAASGSVIAEVMDFLEVLVDLDLGTGDVLQVDRGQAVRVSSYASDEAFAGTVLRIAPAIDAQSRTFRVEVLVPNDAERLRPGMFVRARIVVDRRDDVIVVPPAAVVERDGRLTVFVVEYAKTPGQEVAQESARAREVAVGLVADDAVEVRDGLKSGERVVVSGQDTLKDGTRVIVRG
jgi:membrane fusion protein (multidrug efflux system)